MGNSFTELFGIMERVLHKSPEIASLLVNLYDSNRLVNVGRDDRPEARAELSGVMADLLSKPLPGHEQEVIADVLIALMRQAENDVRALLAERLARLGNAPLRLILHMVNDDIRIAAPILSQSPVLSDLDLVYIIKSQGPDTGARSQNATG